MQLIAYGAQDVQLVERFRYYKQLLELFPMSDNKSPTINKNN